MLLGLYNRPIYPIGQALRLGSVYSATLEGTPTVNTMKV